MSKAKSLNDYYKANFNWLPDHIQQEIGRFNVFKLDDFVRQHYKPVPFGRKDYYKISLIIGKNKVYYADKIFEVKKHAVLFSNPQVPYNWENLDGEQSGYVCVFSADFFYQFGNLKNYEVFQPGFLPVFELTLKQVTKLRQLFEQMMIDLNSSYVHKYDALRNLVFEIVHYVLKTQPAFNTSGQKLNAYNKAVQFLELLEHQFPIEDVRQRLQLRTPADFAGQLAVHVNHLNREVKTATNKTTSQLIAERILQEAKILLRHTKWNISEIAFALGYPEVTHFNNFFKKQMNISPTQFRDV